MKKQLLLFMMMLLPLVANIKVFAHDIEAINAQGKYIYYIWINNKTELAVSFRGTSYSTENSNYYSGNIVIPESVNYRGTLYPVTEIWTGAFSACKNLTSVTIPNSITKIGGDAFYGCTGINSITIPNSVTKISGRAFYGCTALKSINIPYSVNMIEWDAFHETAWYNNQPDGLVYAGRGVYKYKGTMPTNTSIAIKEGTVFVSSGAFSDCSNLSNITIPNTVNSIGSSAFSGCSGLTSVNIPNSVTTIGSGSFSGCNGLISVTIPNSVTSIGQGAFSGCSSLISVNIPNSVTSIEKMTFFDCRSLISIEIPNCVTSIRYGAFSGCSSLISITIPNSVTIIEDGWYDKKNYIGAFSNCYSLNSVTLSNNLESIGNYMFYGCSSLVSVTIPNSVTNIGNNAFSGCSNMISVTIPESVTKIGELAFSNCSSLVSVIIPNNVNSIETKTFFWCTGLKSVTIPNNVMSIGDGAFYNCKSLSSVSLPNSVKIIGESAFSFCGMTEVKLPDELQIIKKEMFKGCSNLRSITIPAAVEYIYQESFANCDALESVKVLPETPPFLYDNSFSNYGISLYVPESAVETYKSTIPWNKFTQFYTLDGSEVVPKQCSKPTISYRNGQLIFKSETEVVRFVSEIKDADIKKYYTETIDLNNTYIITVYATKEGYENSDVAIATLCWIEAEPMQEGTIEAEDGVTEVKAIPVLIQAEDNTISVQGATEGSEISVYNTAGIKLSSTIANKATATLKTNIHSGSTLIVKIGEKAVKVLVK